MRKGMAAYTAVILFMASMVLLNSCSPGEEKTSPANHIIVISSMQFQPSELHIQKGDTVVFINKDMVMHDVTEAKSRAWASPPLSSGQSFRLVVSASANYYCTFHPVMKGKLSVK